MRIEHSVDTAHVQALLHQRALPSPAVMPPRRVQRVSQAVGSGQAERFSSTPPDDAVMLDLSPEGREAARQAALEQLQDTEDAGRSDADQQDAAEASAADERRAQQEIAELARRDREVRAHQQAYSAAGGIAQGVTHYTYEMGPDGRLYAVEGEAHMDVSEIPGDPQATLARAEQIRRTALAPADPSPQDRAVAAKAAAVAARAREEIRNEQQERREETGGNGA